MGFSSLRCWNAIETLLKGVLRKRCFWAWKKVLDCNNLLNGSIQIWFHHSVFFPVVERLSFFSKSKWSRQRLQWHSLSSKPQFFFAFLAQGSQNLITLEDFRARRPPLEFCSWLGCVLLVSIRFSSSVYHNQKRRNVTTLQLLKRGKLGRLKRSPNTHDWRLDHDYLGKTYTRLKPTPA